MTHDQCTRRCPECGETKPHTREHWVPSNALNWTTHGFLALCRLCRNARKRALIRRDKLRALVAYSSDPPVCACCDETILGFLTLDHANNDGKAHRAIVNAGRAPSGATIYQWLRVNNYPQNLGLRVLCFNCNAGRQWNGGVCPHLTA